MTIVHQVVHQNQVTHRNRVHPIVPHHLHLLVVNPCQKVVPIKNNQENIKSKNIKPLRMKCT